MVTLTSVQPLRHSSSSFSSEHRPSVGLQRTYSRNIQNLEQMAEDLSQGGSDIGEEIRKMNQEQKERSRRSSLQSSHQGDVALSGTGGFVGGSELEKMRSRTSSNGVGGSGIVDVNGAARWGGYSPNGFVGSPAGSQRSASGKSHTSAPRKASVASSSRLAQMVEPVQEGRPLDSPLAPSMSVHSSSTTGNEHSREPSGNSFDRQYDQIASQIEQQLDHVPPSPTKLGDEDDEVPEMLLRKPRSQDTFVEAQLAFKDFDGVHFSPETDEFVELDEDGNEIRRVSARTSSGGMSIAAASMLRTPRARPMSYAQPPPGDGMVYYPAPVPRMLNLPKRLSQLPSASVQAQRRSQVLGQIAPAARASAPWIPAFDFANDPSRSGTHRSDESIHQRQTSDPVARPDSGHRSQGSATFIQPVSPHGVHPRSALNQRMSMQNLQNLPPQLRASIFFDHQSQPQDVQVKNESAVATLDSILAASATAPVSAFTDHPFAGDVRKSTYAPEFQQKVRKRQSTATLGSVMTSAAEVEADKKAMKARRRSSFGNLLRRNSSAMELDDLAERRNSRTSSILLGDYNEGGNRLKKRRSQMSLGDEMDRHTEAVRTPGNEISEPDFSSGLISRAHNARAEEEEEHTDAYMANAATSRPPTSHSRRVSDNGRQIDEDFKDEETTDEVPEEGGEATYVQPSTLLAELQVRKAQQKSRNRTAATHYPNGMHSTLLQLDAVEEITRNKRKKTRVPLAWEGTAQTNVEEEASDEDVPLGMLFQGKDGLMNGKRQMGDGKDWDRPLGLMEKRQMEDSEPLSSRRNRMLGLPPSFGRAERALQKAGAAGMMGGGQLYLAGQPDEPAEEDDGEEAGETLADRLRKLRTKDALETAISDTVPKTGDRPLSTFTDDVLSQFGPLDGAAGAGSKPGSKPGSRGKDIATTAAAVEEQAVAGAEPEQEAEAEEETLGQRRARLQRAKDVEARSGLNKLLASNPVGTRAAAKMHVPVEGTLLHSSAVAQAKQRNDILRTNVRSSSYYGLERPLVETGRPGIGVLGGADRVVSHTGLLGMQGTGGARAPSGGFANGVYNNGLGGVYSPSPMQTSYTTPSFGMPMSQQGGYFASPTAGMVGYGMPQYQQQGVMNPMAAYQQPMGGYRAGVPAMTAYGYGMPGQYGVPGGILDEGLDKQKREGIDAWRMSVMH
ncbi:hypothetical protein LTR86_008215 [Recurvomyces mirabilis]|nr:hypothetical protein LTR86_008215 [Recurvomyces mirabilis]